MRVLSGSRRDRRAVTRITAVGRFAVGLAFLGIAAAAAYVAFGTHVMDSVLPSGRPAAGQVLAGMAVWAVAFTAPAAFGLIGLARLASSVSDLRGSRDGGTPAVRHRSALPDDYVVATRVTLPDGRIVPEIVVGPFGVAIIEALPPARVTRRSGPRWEARHDNGRWRPMLNPLERASRDAETVRRWIAHDDRDFVVRVYAAVVDRAERAGSGQPDATAVDRTASCAVLMPAQIPGWLGSLPAQKTLTANRRERVLELLGSPR